MRRLSPLAFALLLTAGVLGAPPPAVAQTMDDFFDDSVLHEIRLTLNSKDWTKLKQTFEENTYYPCTMQWRNITMRNVGIRSRGLGSRSGTKPGLRVDFDRYSLNQTFLDLKSFVLDNLVQDRSMLRERLSMALFRRMGLPAPRVANVRLFVNNQFVGLYAIVETIDKGFLGRTFGADDHGGTENDGYLFEYDYREEYKLQYRGANLDEYKMFDPKTHENDAASTIWGPIEDMIQAINQSPDAVFERDVSPYLDFGMFTRHIAVENFLAEDDGVLGYAGMNNFYFYRFERTSRSQFLPWDKDNTFHSTDFPILHRIAENVLSRRTFALPAFRNTYLDTLLGAADSAMEPDPEAPEFGEAGEPLPRPGWLEREIQRQYQQIRTAAQSDTFKPYTNDEFEEAILHLLDFSRGRAPFVRTEVAKERPPDSVR